jgi:hypothetical protein
MDGAGYYYLFRAQIEAGGGGLSASVCMYLHVKPRCGGTRVLSRWEDMRVQGSCR